MFSENLKTLRNKAGLSQKALGDLIFVSQQTVAKWETSGATPNPDTVVNLANIFGVSTDYLLGKTDSNVEPFSYGDTEMIKIPVYGSIPAGVPMEAIEDILDYEEIPSDWTMGGKEFFALKIKGDSMEPEYHNGDIIIFLYTSEFSNNDDCAVAVNGNDWTFKRVEKHDNGILVKPLNPNYKSMFFSDKECAELPVQIKGVFWELRRKRR